MIELMANESESHAALAEIREQADRWQDAAVHWQHVCRIRSKEPTGYLRLAKAQIKLERWAQARKTVDTVLEREWPQRFQNAKNEAKQLAAKIK
jgi:hypothetical protein